MFHRLGRRLPAGCIGCFLVILLSVCAAWAEDADPTYEGLSRRQWGDRIRGDSTAAQRLCGDLPRSRSVVSLLLDEEDPSISGAVLRALRSDEGVEFFWPQMLQLLRCGSRQVASGAAAALESGAKSLPPVALQALCVLLLREGRDTPAAVLRIMGAMGRNAVGAVPTILLFIKKHPLDVNAEQFWRFEHQLAAETVARMGGAGVAEFIRHAANESPEDASSFLRVLALAGRRVAEPLSEAALRGPAAVREAAMGALSEVGVHGLSALLSAAGSESGVERERLQRLIHATGQHYLDRVGVDRKRAVAWPERLGEVPGVLRATLWSAERAWIDVYAFDWEGTGAQVSRLVWPGMANVSGFTWSSAELPADSVGAASELLMALGGLVLAEPPATGIWSAGEAIALQASVRLPGQDARVDYAYSGIRRCSLLGTEAVRALACREVLGDLCSASKWCPGDRDSHVLEVLSEAVAGAVRQPAWAQRILLMAADGVGDRTLQASLRAYLSASGNVDARAVRYAIDAYARLSGVDLRPEGFSLEDARRVRRRYLQHWGVAQEDGD